MAKKLSPAQIKMLTLLAEGVDTGHARQTGVALLRRGLVRNFGWWTVCREYDLNGVAMKGTEEHSGFTESWQITDAGREALTSIN